MKLLFAAVSITFESAWNTRRKMAGVRLFYCGSFPAQSWHPSYRLVAVDTNFLNRCIGEVHVATCIFRAGNVYTAIIKPMCYELASTWYRYIHTHTVGTVMFPFRSGLRSRYHHLSLAPPPILFPFFVQRNGHGFPFKWNGMGWKRQLHCFGAYCKYGGFLMNDNSQAPFGSPQLCGCHRKWYSPRSDCGTIIRTCTCTCLKSFMQMVQYLGMLFPQVTVP
jgi:hypothetical protein